MLSRPFYLNKEKADDVQRMIMSGREVNQGQVFFYQSALDQIAAAIGFIPKNRRVVNRLSENRYRLALAELARYGHVVSRGSVDDVDRRSETALVWKVEALQVALGRAIEALINDLQSRKHGYFPNLLSAFKWKKRRWNESDLDLLRVILGDGSLDAKWYLDQNQDVKERRHSVLDHFLKYGQYEGRSPSREVSFSEIQRRLRINSSPNLQEWLLQDDAITATDELARANYSSDLLDAWSRLIAFRNPTIAPFWINHAEHLNAPESPKPMPVNLKKLGLKVALTAHIHYLESLQFISPILVAAQQWGIDVFVTTTDQQIALSLDSALATSDAHAIIALVPNRGRNFGPLLVEFAKTLEDYDFFGHIHGKRSSHMDSAAAKMWLQSLLDEFDFKGGLPRALVELLLDSDLGVVGSYDERCLPYWSAHWLSNRPPSDLALPRPDGFLEYPVGGMFWARVTSISPLLAQDYSYFDFPIEDGQLDGTLQHSIERAISSISQSQGQNVAIRTRSGRKVFEVVRDQYLRQISGPIMLNQFGQAKSVSIDFFDTIFGRKTNDAQFARAEAYVSVIPSTSSASLTKYLATRDQVEKELFHSPDGQKMEIIIGETLSRLDLHEWLGNLVERELEVEMSDLYLRPGLGALVEALWCKFGTITVISDTYYPSSFLRRCWEQVAGLHSEHLQFKASCETGFRKDHSFPWTEFHNDGRHLHIGDNLVSDIQIPTSRGIETIHLASSIDLYWMLRGSYPETDHQYEFKSELLSECKNPWLFSDGLEYFLKHWKVL
jgi:hypothetical protein